MNKCELQHSSQMDFFPIQKIKTQYLLKKFPIISSFEENEGMESGGEVRNSLVARRSLDKKMCVLIKFLLAKSKSKKSLLNIVKNINVLNSEKNGEFSSPEILNISMKIKLIKTEIWKEEL